MLHEARRQLLLPPRQNYLDVIEVNDLVLSLLSDAISENRLLSEITLHSVATISRRYQQPAIHRL